MTEETAQPAERSRRSGWITGTALIVLGLLILAAQFIDLPSIENLFLPALGLVFIVWGIAARSGGLLIPGGILAGIGVGGYLAESLPLAPGVEPGVFLVTFGAGFGLITVLSLIFTPDKHWWALIPGGILAAVGAVQIIGGPALSVLEIAGTYWPVILIVIGLYIIIRRR